MGLLLLADLGIRAMDLNAMYADGGMFSRAEICYRYTSVWNWSFHFAGGSWAFQAALFGLTAILALALLAGWQTRLAVMGSWLLLISLHNRVPPILNGGDGLLRMLLFWGMFLPLHRAWSVDGWLARRRGQAVARNAETPVLSVASGAILLQMALMYLFSAGFKSNAEWFRGEVIAGTLAHDFYAKPAGAWALQFPLLLKAMTWGVFALEWLGPLLLFAPPRLVWLRLGGLAALAAMHLGIEVCVTVGLFSFVSLAGLTLFLPAEFWNSRLLARLVRGPRPAAPPSDAGHGRTEERPALAFLAQGACLLALLYVVAINFNSLPRRAGTGPGWKESRFLNLACGMAQKWNMFEDTPSKDGWYVARARLRDGSEADLLRQGAAVDWNRPHFPAGMFPNHRWRKLFREMAYFDSFGYQVFREPVARHLCRVWNARQPPARHVTEFDFVYCTEKTEPGRDGVPVNVIAREQLIYLDLSGSPP